MVSAHVVPLKGAVIYWVIQQCVRDLERWGHYGQITLKSDQEPAIVDVLKEIANLRGSRGTVLEHSLVADSQSNGFIECGIVAGKAFPYRRTYCGTKGRWSCDQIQDSEGDA